jgi:hypothetical protein
MFIRLRFLGQLPRPCRPTTIGRNAGGRADYGKTGNDALPSVGQIKWRDWWHLTVGAPIFCDKTMKTSEAVANCRLFLWSLPSRILLVLSHLTPRGMAGDRGLAFVGFASERTRRS